MTMKMGVTIGKVRSVLGDVNAARRGTIGQRIASRILGKLSGRAIGDIVKGIFGRR